jgi:hypothetical protein
MAPGEVAEWSNAPHSKCGIGASLSGVRIPPSPPVRSLSGWASHFVAKAATPKPIGRRRAALHASYGPAGHPAIISGKTAARPTRFSLPTKISKTTPCKVTGGSLAWMLYPRKHFDTSRLGQKSDYGAGVARSVTTASHSAMLAWNVCQTSGSERRAEARLLSRATRAFSAMYATKRSKPRMLSMRVKL